MDPTDVRTDEKRDRILGAALEVCAQRGVAAARMEEIAARAGVSKGTLYRFFESKEDLLLATILASYEKGLRHVDADLQAARDPRDMLVRLCNALADVLVQVGAHARVHYQAWGITASTPSSEAKLLGFLRAFHAERDQRIEGLFRAGQDAGVFRRDVLPRVVADSVTALLSGFIYRATFDPRAASREALRACFDELVRGFLEPRVSAPDAIRSEPR
ncbi:MAG TPA: TetR/AcrR family transcriptional regulator [Myxococcota bacterium]|nr:TetR/AcrR family transcriptional regulator [Myxococcota bacterium]